MIGFWIVNLAPPSTPEAFDVHTPAGTWNFNRAQNFDKLVDAIANGACANTYSMEFTLPTDATRSALKDAAFLEVLPICLAASYVTGAAVTVRDSVQASEVAFMEVGPHFPRPRGIPDPSPCVATLHQFIEFVEHFVDEYDRLRSVEKLLLLTHFFIDACSCWSLENLYLSGSTILQIIADTEKASSRPFAASHAAARGSDKVGFFDYIAGAADRVGIPAPGHDVVKIRNKLIHEGNLRAKQFPTKADAAVPIGNALRWVDDYIYAILDLGQVPLPRHNYADYTRFVNSFSFD